MGENEEKEEETGRQVLVRWRTEGPRPPSSAPL